MRTRAISTALSCLLLACGSSASPGDPATGHDGGAGDPGNVASDGGGAEAAEASSPTESGAPAQDAASEASSGGPLRAPADTWTWVPLAGMRCGNGSATGVGLNVHPGAAQVLLFLQGGGACYDGATCWGSSPTASNMTGYGQSDFASEETIQASIFQRNAANPFGEATMVFVPYCTGDLHVGTGTATYTVNGKATPTHYAGATNVDTVVAGLATSFSGLTRVFLTGVSAGGFGTFLNQDAVTRGLGGSVPVDVVDDSGPVVAGGVPADWAARFPPGCTGCSDAPSVFAYVRKTYPSTRYGFLTFQTDTVLPAFYGETNQAFAKQIAQFVTSLAPDPNAKAFVDQSSGHVVLAGSDPKAAPYILPWLTQLATGSAAWSNESD